MGRMSGKDMVKQEETLTVVPVLTHLPVDTSTMLTVNGLPQNQAFLYPTGSQEALTSSLSVYCAVSSQSSMILPTNTFRPGIITSSLPHDNLIMTPGVIGQIQSVQLPGNSLIKTDVKDISITGEPLSLSTELCECRWMNCAARFMHLDDLVNHVNDLHVKVERPDVDFQCRWTGCPRKGRGFNARYKMLIHVRTHTNEKPHKCQRCGKCFSRLENLKIHNRSHTGEKPYMCPFPSCNKAYSNSSDRFKHVRTHQEEKPYICKMPGCNKRYTDPSSLRKHVRTHKHQVKDDQLLPTITQTDTSESVYSNRQIVTLTPLHNYTPLNSHGQSSKSTNPNNETVPQKILQTAATPNVNLLTFSPSVTSINPPSNSSIPKSSSNESICQDSPLDLSRSPISSISSSPSVGGTG